MNTRSHITHSEQPPVPGHIIDELYLAKSILLTCWYAMNNTDLMSDDLPAMASTLYEGYSRLSGAMKSMEAAR